MEPKVPADDDQLPDATREAVRTWPSTARLVVIILAQRLPLSLPAWIVVLANRR